METLEEVKDLALNTIRAELEGLADAHKDELETFAKQISETYAKEFWASQTADTDEKKQEHAANLLHLRGQMVVRAAGVTIDLSVEAKAALGRILSTVGSFLVELLKAKL